MSRPVVHMVRNWAEIPPPAWCGEEDPEIMVTNESRVTCEACLVEYGLAVWRITEEPW